MAPEIIKPYVVYHLKRDQLEEMDRGVDPSSQEVVKLYRGLFSGAPRTSRGDMKEIVLAASAERMKRKCFAALELFRLGFYEKVCSVDADCAHRVLEMTTDINQLWYTKKNKKIEIYVSKPRSTVHYDMIFRFGKPFLNMPIGFINLEEKRFETGIV